MWNPRSVVTDGEVAGFIDFPFGMFTWVELTSGVHFKSWASAEAYAAGNMRPVARFVAPKPGLSCLENSLLVPNGLLALFDKYEVPYVFTKAEGPFSYRFDTSSEFPDDEAVMIRSCYILPHLALLSIQKALFIFLRKWFEVNVQDTNLHFDEAEVYYLRSLVADNSLKYVHLGKFGISRDEFNLMKYTLLPSFHLRLTQGERDWYDERVKEQGYLRLFSVSKGSNRL